jgi:hypothetical protein
MRIKEKSKSVIELFVEAIIPTVNPDWHFVLDRLILVSALWGIARRGHLLPECCRRPLAVRALIAALDLPWDRTNRARAGPIAAQVLSVCLGRVTISQLLSGGTAVDVFSRQINKIRLAKAPKPNDLPARFHFDSLIWTGHGLIVMRLACPGSGGPGSPLWQQEKSDD